MRRTLKILTVILCLTFIIFRENLFIGSFFILTKWLIFPLALWLLFRLRFKNKLNSLVSISLTLVLLETLFVIASQNLHKLSRKELLGEELNIVNYNLFFKNNKKSSITSKIKELNPDILVLQEITPSWEMHLKESIGNEYKYYNIKALNGTHGIGIYSKYPLENVQYINNSSKLPVAQIIDVIVGDKKLCLINTHLASPAIAVENPDRFIPLLIYNYNLRVKQYMKIQKSLKILDKNYHAKLLVGDLNTTSYEPLYNKIRNEWCDSNPFPKLNLNGNFPNSSKLPFPLFSIDYILLEGNAISKLFKVIPGGSSDHLGIQSIIRI